MRLLEAILAANQRAAPDGPVKAANRVLRATWLLMPESDRHEHASCFQFRLPRPLVFWVGLR